MQIQIRSQIHRRRGGYFAQGKRRGRADSMYFVLEPEDAAPRPRARKEYLLLFENKIINTKKT
jgi:hypothetical protein